MKTTQDDKPDEAVAEVKEGEEGETALNETGHKEEDAE
jgi:hypothetical protein